MTPQIVVLSAPSGGGKTTIARAVRERHPETFGFSVSATTRRPRPGEQDGVDYYFWDRERFEDEIKAGRFLEYAEYAGQLYGTLKTEVDRVLRSGKHVLLDIDVRGAAEVRKQYPDERAVLIFILPSDPQVLLERLVKRQSESAAELKLRIDLAKQELQQATMFNHWVWNDELDKAVEGVRAAVELGGPPRTLPQDLNWLNKYGYELQRIAQQVFDELHQQKG